MHIHRSRLARTEGFSLLEVIFVVGIIGVLSGMAVMVRANWIGGAKADSAQNQLTAAFRMARERAISDRRNIEIQLAPPNQIQIVRRDVVGNAEVGTTLLETIYLEGRMTFEVPSGVPDLSGGDDLVNGVGENGINNGAATANIFTSEGTFVDQTGDPNNIEIFIGQGTDPLSARAVTVFGPTAYIRSYTWNGRSWTD